MTQCWAHLSDSDTSLDLTLPPAPQVSQEREGKVVDSRCYGLTAGYVRARAARATSAAVVGEGEGPEPEPVATCPFFEQLEESGRDAALPAGIYSLDDLKHYGRTRGWCPYFVARRAVSIGGRLVSTMRQVLLVSRDLTRLFSILGMLFCLLNY